MSVGGNKDMFASAERLGETMWTSAWYAFLAFCHALLAFVRLGTLAMHVVLACAIVVSNVFCPGFVRTVGDFFGCHFLF